jgi:uncharacterized membrane protein
MIEMTNDTKHLLKAAAALLVVDLFWLATGGIYGRRTIELIQGKPIEVRFVSAIFVYLFLAYMLLQTSSSYQAFFYGMCIYGVYDFTNHAVFDHYDWKFAVADTLWGGVLFVGARQLLLAYK